MDSSTRTRVDEVMSTPLETVPKDATVQEVAQRMREKNINGLVVRTHPPSIVTSSDVVAVAADGRNSDEVPVTEVMTESVETVPRDIYLEEVAAMLTSFGIKHLPVVNEDDEYVGMVSSTDVTAELS